MQYVFDNSWNVPPLMTVMAEYFCGFQPRNKSNLYNRFLHELRDTIQEIMFSTLNYELLFELALESFGLRAECFLENTINIPFLKLHGSCNFVMQGIRLFNTPMKGGNLIDAPLKAVNVKEAISYCRSGDSGYPAMCIYMESKPTQFGSGKIKAIQERWKKNVLNAERILIIGVKPNEADRHIWEPLIETDAKIGYIGSINEFNKWIMKYRNNKQYQMIGKRWSDHLNDSVNFLNSKE